MALAVALATTPPTIVPAPGIALIKLANTVLPTV